MLYVEVNTLWEFERNMPKSRLEAYSYEGIEALFDYWYNRSEELGENIELDESLTYDCTEYDSAEDAVNDLGDIDEIRRDLVEDYLYQNDIELEDEDDWEKYIDELDEDELNDKCVEWLHDNCDHVEELNNGHVFVVES